jgi:hypothetical protein
MNKQLMLAIILVSMIPGIAATAHGISGFLVANSTEQSINQSTNISANASAAQSIDLATTGGMAIFYTGAAVLLVIAITYLLNLYRTDNKKATSNVKVIKNVHTAEKAHTKHTQNLVDSLKILTQKIRFAKLSNDKAEKYIVFVVALVAIVGILVMVLR